MGYHFTLFVSPLRGCPPGRSAPSGPASRRHSRQRLQFDLKSGGSWIRLKEFDFSRQLSKKLRFYSGNFTQKIDFPDKFPKNFNFFQAISQRISIFQAKLAIYRNFWANYSISLQKSPLSNILPVQCR